MSEARQSHLWPGAALALGAAGLFGVVTPLSKLLVGAVDPQMLAGLLYLGAGIGLAGVHFGRRTLNIPAQEAALKPTDLPWLAAVILFGGILGPLFLMLGVARCDASSASLLLNLEGIMTMAIAWIVFRENVDRRLLAGALAILAGAAVLSWHGGAVALDSGSLLIAAACLSWGIDNNLTRKLSSADPVMIAMSKGLAAGAANTTIALAQGAPFPAAKAALAAALLGFLAIGVSLVLFIRALRHLGTARTGAYFSLAPFIGTAVAIVALNEPMTQSLLVAGVLMGFGLWLHLAERHEHDHLHEAIEHDHSHVHDDGHHDHHHDYNDLVDGSHAHSHRHRRLWHRHVHYPDLHHRHSHD
jgi:drug/metabolite transporter (DMT)-like permease